MKGLKKVIFIVILVSISISLLVVGNGYDMYKEAIQNEPLLEKVASIKQKDDYAIIEELPQTYLNAVVATEDHRFFQHIGIDVISIGRAVIKDIKALSFVEGGSTITQQLAKNLYFTQEKQITRKIAEMFMSFHIERNYEKEEILELYVNTSYFGEGCYGIKEACIKYFQKDPINMTDNECTLLAGIPNAPSNYSLNQNKERALKRQKQVLKQMVKYHYLSEEEVENILEEK